MVDPHGGILIDRLVTESKRNNILSDAGFLPRITLSSSQIQDVINIASGVYSPLTGFMRQADFSSVVDNFTLSNGLVWPLPVFIDISNIQAQEILETNKVLLTDQSGRVIAILENYEVYSYDKDLYVKNIFGTTNCTHPGVANIYAQKELALGGDIWLLDDFTDSYDGYDISPYKMRGEFIKRNWNSIVAFQTRNVPHRGHEYIQKQVLKDVDGLLIQPVVGKKKEGDFKDEYILGSYEILCNKYLPVGRTILGVLPIKMSYAGPREAIFHALIRKNYGCTHFIVGRDHAGVGNFYQSTEAQDIFDKFSKDQIGIEIIKYSSAVYCTSCQDVVLANLCPHDSVSYQKFSGTKLRGLIKQGLSAPEYLIRPEIYNFLNNGHSSLVDDMYIKETQQQGFVLWLTGLSQAGKSTIADGVYGILAKENFKVERLDGDIVREGLSQDLGFSKEDRDENIRRVGHLARLLSQNGVGVIASFISPYKRQRQHIREQVKNLIEVFVDAPLEVCEERDTKGLYAKARSGEIENFTGISDPYESPINPEIYLNTSINSVEENIEKVVTYLKNKCLI